MLCVRNLKYSHSAFGFIYKVEEDGEISVLCFKTKNLKFPSRWVLPGGSGVGVSTPLDTVQRECRQELAKNWRDIKGFHVEFEKDPAIIVQKESDGGRGGIHEQHFFIGHEVLGELRDVEIQEPDRGPDTLGVPTYMELGKLVEILQVQGRKSRHQLRGVLVCLEDLASKDILISRKVCEKYLELLPH